MASGPIRRRVIVTGHVQGVFFRDTTRRQATRQGVAGWARNCRDGTVEVVLEGAAEAVEAVIAFCRSGSERASVSDVAVSDDGAPEGLAGFEIR